MIYYIRPTGTGRDGTGNGQSTATAWSISYFNATAKASVVSDDIVLFENGFVYEGGLTIQNSGTAGHPVTFGTYGPGAKARISGLVIINPAIDSGNGVRSVSLTGLTSINVVTVDDDIKPMGRYPRFDWLQINSHSGNLQLTDNDLPDSPSFVGAEICRRDQRYLTNRFTVTSQSSGVVNMSLDNWAAGSNAASVPLDLNGYFFQNHMNAVRFDVNNQVQFGDWYYDAGDVFYIYFGFELPSSHVVKVSNTNIVLNLTNMNYIVFDGLVLEGGNQYSVYAYNASQIEFNNCDFLNSGWFAMYMTDSDNIRLIGCRLERCEANGIHLISDLCTVENFYGNDIALDIGMGNNGDGNGNCLVVNGNGNTVLNAEIWNVGYIPIEFGGQDFLLDGFYIDTYCINKDDGGGVYVYESQNPNRIVRNGVIRNGFGALEGGRGDTAALHGKAAGLYFDDNVKYVTAYNITVDSCNGEGCFVHGASDLEIHHCTFYNNRVQMYYNEWLVDLIFNVNRHHNKYISKEAGQLNEFFHVFQAYTDFATFGPSDYNIYATPGDVGSPKIRLLYDQMEPQTDMTLTEWKIQSDLDEHSIESSITAEESGNFRVDVNETSEEIFVPIEGVEYRDVEGNIYSPPGYNLAPFSGNVLLYYREATGTGDVIYYTINGGKLAKSTSGKFYVKQIPT